MAKEHSSKTDVVRPRYIVEECVDDATSLGTIEMNIERKTR